jgi:hypothetical protein
MQVSKNGQVMLVCATPPVPLLPAQNHTHARCHTPFLYSYLIVPPISPLPLFPALLQYAFNLFSHSSGMYPVCHIQAHPHPACTRLSSSPPRPPGGGGGGARGCLSNVDMFAYDQDLHCVS